jgi:hypothetical protein
MKYWRMLLLSMGFVFQVILPICIFGMVIPYTHGELKSGLTGAGIIALAVLVIVISGKVKDALKQQPKSWLRGLILSLFPISVWCILGIGIEKVSQFFLVLVEYWWLALIFIIIGRIFYIVEESLNG